jgi:uncharacterized protein YndB with AHSA1/START domain
MESASRAANKFASVGDEAVKRATDRTWAEWFAIFDKSGCKKMTHREIVAVAAKHGAGRWWQQMVAVGYEQARGLRAKHQKPEGYEISVSKTIAVPVAKAFAAWEDLKQRRRWLSDPDFTVRKATANKSMRITWADGKTNLEVMFYSKDEGKCQVVAQHGKLLDAKAGGRMKKYWAAALEKLKAQMEN